MSHTKKAWIISSRNQFVVQKNGMIYQYNLVPNERNGYANAKTAKQELYHARRALHDPQLRVMVL